MQCNDIDFAIEENERSVTLAAIRNKWSGIDRTPQEITASATPLIQEG